MSGLWALVASADDVDAEARAEIAAAMEGWLRHGGAGVLVATCHRAELYGFGPGPELSGARELRAQAATRHLFRVAAGLESVIVGEDEVLHQVREALAHARAARGLESRLDGRLQRLFETAIAAGRQARARRTEASGNLAQTAVGWLSLRSNLAGRRVVVAGAGRMGSSLAHTAAKARADVVIASRDAARARRLASLYGGAGVDLETGARLVEGAAAVAVALAGPWSELEAVGGARLPPIADISAPSAVPHAVRSRLNGGFLGIDDLFQEGRVLPGAYIKDAERVVDRSTADYAAWLEGVA